MNDVAVVNIDKDLAGAVRSVFEKTIPGRNLIKSSGEVFLKPNGIDFKPYAFTSLEVLERAICRFKESGASKVFVMENRLR